MAIIKNLTGETIRFVDANDSVVKTIEPDAIVVTLADLETTTTLQGILIRTLKPFAFVNLPAVVAGTFLIVRPGIARALHNRFKNRTDVYEPEDPIYVGGELCYRAVRHYVD